MLLSWLYIRLSLATEDAYKGLEDQNQNKTPKCCRSITGRHQCLLCLATGTPTALAPTATGLARP